MKLHFSSFRFRPEFLPSSKTLLLSCAVLFSVATGASAQSYALNPLWSIAPMTEGFEWIATNNVHRGLAYNHASGNLLTVSRHPSTATAVYILNGSNGSFVGNLDVTGVFIAINFPLNMIDVAEDGIIYACNLAVDAAVTNAAGNNGPFRIYRWENESAAPTVAYIGDPSNNDTNLASAANRRFGDSLAVRGSGPNTQILAATRSGKIVAFFTTADGTNFVSQIISVPVLAGGAATVMAIGFGQGNEFWIKPENSVSHPLMRFSFNPVDGTSTLLESFTALTSAGGPLDFDPARNLVGLVGTKAHEFRLYKLTSFGEFVLQDQPRPFPTTNANGNYAASVSFGSDKVFALDANNGIIAFNIFETNLPPEIVAFPGNRTVMEGAPNVALSVTVSGTDPFFYQWQFEQADIEGATNSTFSLTDVTMEMAGKYRVIVSNVVNTVISGEASLTVLPVQNTAQMTNIWNLAPDSRPYLTTNYTQYGLAYNPVTTNLLLVTRTPTNNIHVLDALTGAEKHTLDLTAVGGPLHKVDVADDGTVFACNLTFNAATTLFRIYYWTDDQPTTQPLQAYFGDPGAPVIPGVAWGRKMAVRGTGTETQILVATTTSNYVAVMRFTGGVGLAFPETTLLEVPGVVNGFARLGLAWGKEPNTFWAKAASGPLYLIQFDAVAGTASILKQFNTDVFPATATTLAYDSGLDMLGVVDHGTVPKNVRMYDVSDLESTPVLLDQEIFSTANAGIEASGAMDFGPNLLFVLDTNNGIKAFEIDPDYVPQLGPFRILSVANENGEFVLTWESVAGKTYNITYENSLSDATWLDAGSVVASGATASFTNSISGNAKFYQVVAE